VSPALYAAELRLSLQNKYASWLKVSMPILPDIHTEQKHPPEHIGNSALSISNRAWTMSGYAVRAGRNDTLEEFLSYSASQIRNRLKKYLTDKPALNSKTEDLIILDIEYPVHPRKLGQHEGAQLAQIVEAFKTRIKIVRQKFPKAKLSMYGVIVPISTGDSSNANFKKMMEGYIQAGHLGMFDDLDYLSPSLYLRFAPGEKMYNYIAAYTQQGLDASRDIRTSKGMQLPLVPMLTSRVFNGRSKHHRQCIPVESIQKQLKIIRRYPFVEIIVLWLGNAEPATSTEWCSPQKFIQTLSDFHKSFCTF
jgi:hypothetical protein